jgi:hypothetical protein
VHTQGQDGSAGGNSYQPNKKARNNNGNYNRQQHRPANHAGGPQPMDTSGGPSGSVAAVTGSARPQQPRPSKVPWVEKDPILSTLPICDCPIKPGHRLSAADRQTLWRWGICTFCRAGRHTHNECPQMAKKAGPRPSEKRK